MEFDNVEVDIGGQSIEQFDANPYELVIALSKKAREFNSKAMKYLGPETEIKPISVVLNKLYTEEGVSFSYDAEEENAAEDAPEPIMEPPAPVEKKDESE